MSYTQILSRMLGIECLNYGFSGNGKGHIEIAQALSGIENVRSFVPQKYIYPNKDKSNTVMYWLFSDQTMLTYFEGKEKRQKYNNQRKEPYRIRIHKH